MSAPSTSAVESLSKWLRHHSACFHEGLTLWNRDEETCDCGLSAAYARALDAAPAPEREKRRWLIERTIDGVPYWLAWRGRDEMTWTPIALDADRYGWGMAASRDARLIGKAHGIECAATEHIFLGSTSPAPPAEVESALRAWRTRFTAALTGPVVGISSDAMADLLATVTALVSRGRG